MNASEGRAEASIVVGVDGSPASILALRWAAALAPVLSARVVAVAAWQFHIAFGTFEPVVWNPDEEARKMCKQAVAKALGATPAVDVDVVIRQGPAAKVLVEESRRAQLLVLGSRGHGGFEGLLLGSVSAAMSEHAKCSVLIAHGTELPPGLSVKPASESGTFDEGADDDRR